VGSEVDGDNRGIGLAIGFGVYWGMVVSAAWELGLPLFKERLGQEKMRKFIKVAQHLIWWLTCAATAFWWEAWSRGEGASCPPSLNVKACLPSAIKGLGLAIALSVVWLDLSSHFTKHIGKKLVPKSVILASVVLVYVLVSVASENINIFVANSGGYFSHLRHESLGHLVSAYEFDGFKLTVMLCTSWIILTWLLWKRAPEASPPRSVIMISIFLSIVGAIVAILFNLSLTRITHWYWDWEHRMFYRPW